MNVLRCSCLLKLNWISFSYLELLVKQVKHL